MAGMPYPPKCVLWAIHLCSVGAAETAAPPKLSVGSVHSVGEYSTHPLGGKHKEGMAECHALLFVIFAWLLHLIEGVIANLLLLLLINLSPVQPALR